MAQLRRGFETWLHEKSGTFRAQHFIVPSRSLNVTTAASGRVAFAANLSLLGVWRLLASCQLDLLKLPLQIVGLQEAPPESNFENPSKCNSSLLFVDPTLEAGGSQLNVGRLLKTPPEETRWCPKRRTLPWRWRVPPSRRCPDRFH